MAITAVAQDHGPTQAKGAGCTTCPCSKLLIAVLIITVQGKI